jgi:invasion protein IalB
MNMLLALSHRIFRLSQSALLGLLLLASVQLTAQAQAQTPNPSPPPQAQTFQGWLLTCEVETQPCFVSQSTHLKDTGERVLRVVAGHLGAEGKPVLHLSVPLGIYLPLGVALKIDEGAQLKVEVHTCTPGGCEAMLNLDAELLGALSGGKVSQVAFLDAVTRRQVTVAVPMAGFKEAYAALEQKAAAR